MSSKTICVCLQSTFYCTCWTFSSNHWTRHPFKLHSLCQPTIFELNFTRCLSQADLLLVESEGFKQSKRVMLQESRISSSLSVKLWLIQIFSSSLDSAGFIYIYLLAVWRVNINYDLKNDAASGNDANDSLMTTSIQTIITCFLSSIMFNVSSSSVSLFLSQARIRIVLNFFFNCNVGGVT